MTNPFAGDPVEELLPFRRCKSVAEVRTLLRQHVEREVEAMTRLVDGLDAFDVIELMRMREFPVVPDPRAAPAGGSGLYVELVAALMISRGSRVPTPSVEEDSRPHLIIEELHQRCAKIGRVASYRSLMEGQLQDDNPLAALASEYQGTVLNVSNLQYDHIRDRHDKELFDSPAARELMLEHLGYSYGDVLGVRTAMQEISARRLTQLRDVAGDLFEEHGGVDPQDLPPDVVEKLRGAMTEFMFLPASRAVITPDDVAAEAGFDRALVVRVMGSFSQVFDPNITATDRIYSLLTGTNPFLARPLLAAGEDEFVLTNNEIGLDSLRRVFEQALTANQSHFRKYDQKARQQVSETLAVGYLSNIFDTADILASYYHWTPKPSVGIEQLGPAATNVQALADRAEGDALFIVDDVAFIVEVKGKSIADRARRGDIKRLATDLKATVRDAARQISRVRQLISVNGGFWTDKDTWHDLSGIREIRGLIVLLDDVGPLGTDLNALQRAGMFGDQVPLILSMHDLAVISEIGDRPAEFLLYHRRRTDSPVRTFFRAIDELDLYMTFLEGALFVEDDPDAVKRAHPAIPDVATQRRQAFQESAVGTFVADKCVDLNAWMVRANLPDDLVPPKPAFNAPAKMLALVDDLRRHERAGWFRGGADLLALAGDTQIKVIGTIFDVTRRTRADGDHHDALLAFAGTWGFPLFVVAANPDRLAVQSTTDRLRTYARAKQYQIQADRAYGLVFDTKANLVDGFYLDPPPAADANLDQQVIEMGLRPTGRPRKPVPPSARRTRARLRGKRRKS